LKCDEVKPTCGQCIKSNRDCGFSGNTKFRHFDAQFPNEQGLQKTTSLENLESHFRVDQVWLDVPANLTFVNVANPFEIEDTLFSEDEFILHHKSVQIKVVTSNETNTLGPTISPCGLETYSTQNDNQGPQHTPECADDPKEDADVFVATGYFSDIVSMTPSAKTHGPGSGSPSPVPDKEEIDHLGIDAEANVLALQLLRHFREGPGQWRNRMDLFDTTAYFSCKIPLRATTRPLLKSAICALAAKHLSRIQSDSRNYTFKASLAFSSTSRVPDWQYHAVRYYHQAIRCLKNTIAVGRNTDTSDGNDIDSRHMDTFAAVAILCMYELMNAPGDAWKAHLTALPLYSATPDGGFNECYPAPIPYSSTLKADKVSTKVISETQTRLNLDHIQLWQNFGLATDDNKLLLPFSPSCIAEIRASTELEEDTKSNELLWLLGKIVNFITSGDAISPEDFSKPNGERMSLGLTQEFILERWSMLEMELQKWLESLPPTFSPSARTELSAHDVEVLVGPGERVDMEKIWYDIPMCAATMQSYHMACILLLVNRPQESTAIRSTVSARLRSYRHIQKEVLRHGREICGISLADPPDSVRIHSVQPLFITKLNNEWQANEE
ncbi:zn 2cys6 transcription factor, partial [Colletotrichum incanum]